ncbi:hypothetical protein RMAECT_0426 [Rickettsia rhipicephali str. Ect]|uniref:Uncharacterized protein n=2 Tax=spotted fever group TaxID=114277 RepID=A0A0F3PH12_RICRH|nr:hypothetical protein RMB_01425 [Rickettsia massiliae str. AZT80]KJV79227.1 hypothetical protein RMAECT_0426 [Rickettsia rhipicephali str. Ect]
MQNAIKQDEEMIGAIYNPIHDIIQMSLYTDKKNYRKTL